jgi:hypothetical protein
MYGHIGEGHETALVDRNRTIIRLLITYQHQEIPVSAVWHIFSTKWVELRSTCVGILQLACANLALGARTEGKTHVPDFHELLLVFFSQR